MKNVMENRALVRMHPFLKALTVLLVVLAGLWTVYSSPLSAYLHNLNLFRQRLNEFGWMAPLVFTVLITLLASFGFSRLLLSVAAGVLFGFYRGLASAMAGTLAGAYILFLFARWAGRDAILRRWPRVNEISHLFNRFGLPVVLALRLTPVSGLAVNCALAVMPVSHRDFLVGSFLGFLPAAIPCVLAGSGAMHESHATAYVLIAAAMLLLAVVWYFTARYVLKLREASNQEPLL